MPVRYLQEFIESLPEESVVGHCRDLGTTTVWWNRLLYELSRQEKCSIYEIEPHFVHEAEQGISSDRVLDEVLEFDEVVHACILMRSAAYAEEEDNHFEQLSYGERVKLQEQLEAKREHCAMELLRASVGAWRMLRHPPEEVAERIAADPTGNEEKVWHMQVSCLTVPSWLLLPGCCCPLTYEFADCHL